MVPVPTVVEAVDLAIPIQLVKDTMFRVVFAIVQTVATPMRIVRAIFASILVAGRCVILLLQTCAMFRFQRCCLARGEMGDKMISVWGIRSMYWVAGWTFIERGRVNIRGRHYSGLFG